MLRSTHLNDDRLFQCYLGARTGDALDARDADHLSECEACTARYRSLVGFMDGLRQDGDAEVDAIFTGERLQAQQAQIMRRLTHVHRPARVISFPGREPAAPAAAVTRVPPRWLAAAAAAGLFIGVAVGGLLGPTALGPTASGPGRAAMQVASAPRASQAPAVRVSAPAEPRDDDAFLLQLEAALASPQLRELQAVDALTPHVREVRTQVR